MVGMAHVAMGWGGGEPNPAEALKHLLGAAKVRSESGNLTDNETLSKFCKVVGGGLLSEYECLSNYEEWDLASVGCTEELICDFIDFYDFSRDGAILKVSDC